MPDNLCRCGCGQRTPLAKWTDKRYGTVAGQPLAYVRHHWFRGRGRERHPQWKGGRSRQRGYVVVNMPEHPRANVSGYVYEHILVAERVLGKPLPEDAVVHHVNGVKHDNRRCNLVICDRGYHSYIHGLIRRRERRAS